MIGGALASAAGTAPLSLVPLAALSDTGPIWVQLVKAVVIFIFILQIVPIVLWAERRLLGLSLIHI